MRISTLSTKDLLDFTICYFLEPIHRAIESRKSDSQIWLRTGDTIQMITFKEFTFEAAHMTPPYSTLHGHTFKVELQFSGKPDPKYGWAVCLDDVQKDISDLRAVIDQKYLNDIPGLQL